MDNNLETVLIVDSVLAANPYYDFFKAYTEKKFNIINIVSDIHNRILFDKYIEYLKTDGFLTSELSVHSKELDQLKIAAIFCGSDCGFLAYAKLMEKFFPEKKIRNADIKANKFRLYSFLREQGLVKTNQQLINQNSYKTITEIARPSVLKPLGGNGGKDTYYINHVHELAVIENSSDFFILMDKIEGQEYSVDFISCNGVHKLNAVWKYTKWPHHHHREEIDLVDPKENKELIDKIYNFLVSVFFAVEHRDGPTHSEVIVNDQGVNLIEVNFRLHGHLGNIMQKMTIGRTQAIESFVNFNDPVWASSDLRSYRYIQPLKKVLLNNKREKYIETVNWEDFEKCSSVATVYKHPIPVPCIIPISTSVQTTLGFVMMTNKNIEKFNHDVETVRALKDQLCS